MATVNKDENTDGQPKTKIGNAIEAIVRGAHVSFGFVHIPDTHLHIKDYVKALGSRISANYRKMLRTDPNQASEDI